VIRSLLAEGLHKTYRRRTVVRDVTLRINGGEIVGLLGPNGAGKTTLLRIACGYLWPNGGGQVYRQGKALVDLRELRRSIGWATSTLNAKIPPREAAVKTVVSGKFAQIGLWDMFWDPPTTADYALARQYLDDLGCADLADVPFGALSQGEQQKVLIARARMTVPYLIILDEPCAGMDPGSRENFLAALQKLALRADGPTLVYVTHHIEEIMPAFRKTLIMKDGRIIANGYTKDLIGPKTILQLYGVTADVVVENGRYWFIHKGIGEVTIHLDPSELHSDGASCGARIRTHKG